MPGAPMTPVPVQPPTGPSFKDFAESVATMRRLQQQYFRTRDPKLLATAKKLEQQIDATCVRILRLSPQQQELFDTTL